MSLEDAIQNLSPIQLEAVSWQDGACLVLAGPGAGKTRVLTTRIARILNDSQERKLKFLALTFTTKAAGEMSERVKMLVPGLAEERTFIGTFHAFAVYLLRQHGSHIGIRPDFGIFGQKEDQEALLADAIQTAMRNGGGYSMDDLNLLPTIKEFKSRLITPEKSFEKTKDEHVKAVYELYENALKEENAMDIEGLILEACRLLAKVPAVAARIRQSYPYWLIDEFQDTSPAQYWLLHYLSAGQFKNIFVVADDDQIIYQWAGASYRQIEKLIHDYQPSVVQLVQNHRCPPEIVSLANQLVSKNTQRAPGKQPTVSSRETPVDAVSLKIFETETEEYDAIAQEITRLGKANWGDIVVLARTRSLLESLENSLVKNGVNAVISKRRDNFVSPQFVWLHACLDQTLHPTNKRLFANLVDAANRFCGMELDPVLLVAEARAGGENYYEYWAKKAASSESELGQKLGALLVKLAGGRDYWPEFVKNVIPLLMESVSVEEGSVSDAEEDLAAWNTSMREIRSEAGSDLGLSDVIQGMALRSKEPPRESNTVALMTIHLSKGLEFKYVFVIGLAEGEMPSWQSCKKGDDSREMEEERRNCFVAITRTQEKLNLSAAKQYRGRAKIPSRFLGEMSIITD